jgi:hypothetical protein
MSAKNSPGGHLAAKDLNLLKNGFIKLKIS